jgi:hypothetical protein
MVLFFFYNKLTNVELLKKINNNFETKDGYIIMQNYDIENNILEISDNQINNNQILNGKIVNFDMKLEDVIMKINEIDECKNNNKTTKYIINTIYASKISGGVCKTYIIY